MERKEKSKIEKLFEGRRGRERRDSMGSIEELLKRKRDEMDRSGDKEEEIFKRSNIMERSPEGRKEREGEGLEKWMRELGGKVDRLMNWMECFKKDFGKQENKWKEMIEEMREDFKAQRSEWVKEREEMRRDMRELKDRLELLEKNGSEVVGERQRRGEGEGEIMWDRIGRIEKSMEGREREKRRRNIVMKGMEVKDGKRREAVKEILEIIGAKVEVKEVKKIGEITEKGRGEMLLVKLENEEQKWEVMAKKKNLKGRKERIMEDLTWRERRTRWNIGEIARKEMAEGRRVWMKGGRIRIEGQWWKWDEEREKLVREGGGAEAALGEGK